MSPQDSALAKSLSALPRPDAETLRRAGAIAAAEGLPLHRVLIDRGWAEEETVLPALCKSLAISWASSPYDVPATDTEAVAHLTAAYLRKCNAVPLAATAGAPQPVLMADPADAALLSELAFHLDRPVTPIGATTKTIRAVLSGRMDAAAEVKTDTDLSDSGQPEETPPEDGPVMRLVQETLAEAVASGASDIHFESRPGGISIRMRVNGLLSELPADPSVPAASVLARLKVMARANVAERRLPQDARFGATLAGRRVDFRLSSLPTQHGESIALRVLDPNALRLGWDRLGFDADMAARIKAVIEQPSGLFLVTGPTGSGKTTTLYTALQHLNSPRRKIVTVEDPVEYALPGVQQVQVQDEIGLTFARVLRSFLRHDPNVIMIGEIRDAETAAIACRAAQVGRMVLSSLHTRTAAGAPMRLMDLGVPDYIVRDVLRGVLGQELVLSECPSCGGSGCPDCCHTGSSPRRLKAELVEFD